MMHISKNSYKKLSIILTVIMLASLLLPIMASANVSVLTSTATSKPGDSVTSKTYGTITTTTSTLTTTSHVTNLTLTGPSGKISSGGSKTYTATATDIGGTPLYQFWLHDIDNNWKVIQDYSTNNTCNVNLQNGSYVVTVYAIDSVDKANNNWQYQMFQSLYIYVNSSVTLSAPSTGTVW